MEVTPPKVKKGYKQTEVGVIPQDWEIRQVRDITTNVASGKSNTSNELGSYPIYGSTGVIGYKKSFDYYGNKILVARVGANAGTVNIVSDKYCVSDNTLMVSYLPDMDVRFSYYQMVNFKPNKLIFGSGQPLVTGTQIKNITFAIPKKNEQTAIADALSDTDELIQSLDVLIEKKKNIKTATMQQLLSGKTRLAGFGGEWKTVPVGTIVDFAHGRGLPKSDIHEGAESKCIHYGQLFTEYGEKVGEVRSRTDVTENAFISKVNDVLIPTSDVTPRGLATSSCIKEDGVILGGGILVLRPKADIDGCFISYFITNNKNAVLKLVKGSTVFHLYANDLSQLEVYMPPTAEEQTAIVTVLEEMNLEINALKKRRDKLISLKQGMMYELLTGNTRLV